MRWWPMAALVAACAFVLSGAGLLMARSLPWITDASRSILVGSGALLAALVVGGLAQSAVRARAEREQPAEGRLVSMHPRKRA